MADGINMSFRKHIIHNIYKAHRFLRSWTSYTEDDVKRFVDSEIENGAPLNVYIDESHISSKYTNPIQNIMLSLHARLEFSPVSKLTDTVDKILRLAIEDTKEETHQAMESAIHNLNSMQSRAGNQTPFSSINFGTELDDAGRLATYETLRAIDEGLGNGETAIFPVSIYRVKDGINFKPGDPCYDLYQYAIKVSAKRLFPNFEFADAPFNQQYYIEGNEDTEIATMGCRTRVVANVNGPSIVARRGNCSFTTINLPLIALDNKGDVNGFFNDLDKYLRLTADQLYERLQYQGSKKVKNFPFLMGEGLWLDSEKLGAEDTLESVVKHGTLSIGFVGLAECLVALIGKHHGESSEAQELGLRIVKHMRKFCDEEIERSHLNYSLLATPAESYAGNALRAIRKKYGKVPGVSDRDYVTNSNHVPVYYDINAFDKIEIEAPYHALCNAGHICYVELDGDVSQNLEAMEELLAWMKECGVGYGSFNHPVDYDPVCGYVGIINDICPRCGRKEFEAIPIQRLKRMGIWRDYNSSTIGYSQNTPEEQDRKPNLYLHTNKED